MFKKIIRTIFTVEELNFWLFLFFKFRGKSKILGKLLQKRIALRFGFYVGLNTIIGNDFQIRHPIGIVIGEGVEFGNNVVIYQGTTFGVADFKELEKIKEKSSDFYNLYPTIKNGVTIYANSTIIGGVTIGENSIIAANSFVNKDVPPNTIVAGSPAKVIKYFSKH